VDAPEVGARAVEAFLCFLPFRCATRASHAAPVRGADKATALEDRVKFQWLDGYLSGRLLHTITRDDVQAIGAAKARESSRATANRYLALVRAVLKRAAGPWQWIEKAPSVTLYPEAKRRVRWLNKQEATRLLDALPTHQKQLTRFALATGLRRANVLGLKWSDVDMDRRTAWVHADEAKGGEAIGVPLNDEAVAVLREELGKHPLRVFTFKGKPLGQANTRAWRNALKRAGIRNFRWHDLRHVWATWHVMAGTTLAELQELGAWCVASSMARNSRRLRRSNTSPSVTSLTWPLSF
jgi:integrase